MREENLNQQEEKAVSSILIGVGGWAYLPIKHGSKLKLCSKLYDYVELNSTYYKLPSIQSARKWRAAVPESFEFTVRANGKLTHENHLEPTEENHELYKKMVEICGALRASILHFQFPPSFEVTKQVVKDWRDFFDSATSKDEGSSNLLHLAFEIRNRESAKLKDVKSFFADYDIIPTVDASKEGAKLETSADSKIVYTRVFGQGDHTQWSFDTDELNKLKEKVESISSRRRYITFHNITMYEDASRLRSMAKGSSFPP